MERLEDGKKVVETERVKKRGARKRRRGEKEGLREESACRKAGAFPGRPAFVSLKRRLCCLWLVFLGVPTACIYMYFWSSIV